MFSVAPGPNFDLASFSFQVPMFASAARHAAAPAKRITRVIRIVFGFMSPPFVNPILVAIRARSAAAHDSSLGYLGRLRAPRKPGEGDAPHPGPLPPGEGEELLLVVYRRAADLRAFWI